MILSYLFVDLSCPAKQVVLWWIKVFCFWRTSFLWSSGDCRNMPPSSPQRIGAAPPAEQSVPVIRTALKVTNGNKCWWRIMNSDECWWRHDDDLTVTWLKWPAFMILQYIIIYFMILCQLQHPILNLVYGGHILSLYLCSFVSTVLGFSVWSVSWNHSQNLVTKMKHKASADRQPTALQEPATKLSAAHFCVSAGRVSTQTDGIRVACACCEDSSDWCVKLCAFVISFHQFPRVDVVLCCLQLFCSRKISRGLFDLWNSWINVVGISI